ncbi:ABC transporter substrate-binding protein [Carboxydochorda subterranea]|uniref:ABC transporter substrate-binding protein n=1 Tax=Carboxydichorda subterranea TaxID=3109565 RepID=A0ABZ1C1M9_9FIRM|nr:ABC transporter substrate-binding protein [Limnochorda sp. L945t]WRP18208.1 ABC transporter substrate-binding protein [Limnochorda sp. L945t]
MHGHHGRALALLASLLLVVGLAAAAGAAPKNPDTLVKAEYGEPETLDPAFAYDTASGEVIYQIYENLIAFDGSDLTKFVPMLATQVPSVQNGLISKDGKTYRFPIRKGVRFHDGTPLTPADVEYSFERIMLQDRNGGPAWMILEPLLGVSSIEQLATSMAGVKEFKEVPADVLRKVYDKVDKAVEVQGDSVIFHLARPYPPFLSILAHNSSWSSIISKKWAIAQGDWDGKPDNWVKWHDPKAEEDPLFEKANGTGPFKLVTWEHGSQVILERNDDYWRKPAQLKRVVIKKVDEWSTRLLMLQSGDADIIVTDPQYLGQVEKLPGVTVLRKLPWVTNTTMFFTYQIAAEGNPYIGSGKLDGNGIPPDFFMDIDVRKAFNYAFDFDTYIKDVVQGEGTQARGPIPRGLPFFNPEQPVYKYDPKKAEEHFKKAWGGKLWQTGFKMTITYNSGNDARRIAGEILKQGIESINPKFHIDIQAVQWPTFLQAYLESKLPIFTIGWLADFPDPHNFAVPYLAKEGGTYAPAQRFPEEWYKQFQELIDKGMSTTDPKQRQEAYYKMQQLAYDYALDIFLVDRTDNRVMRDWVKGFYPNAIRPGDDFYPMYKEG